MEKKIIFIITIITLSCLTEINAQMDTVWSYPLPDNYKVASWSFSPNDSLITIAFSSIGDSVQEGYNILLNTQNGQKIREFRGTHSSKLFNTLFTPDNRFLITSALTDIYSEVNIIMWNVSTGDSVRRLTIDSLKGLEQSTTYNISDLQFTPDGRYLFGNLSRSYWNGDKDNYFVFWDTTNWQIAKQWKSTYEPNSMLISPRGNYYAFYYGKCDSGNCIKIVSLDSADTLIKNLYLGDKEAFNWCFSKGGKYLATDCDNDSLIIWDMDSLKIYKTFNLNLNNNVGFAKDSAFLITKGQKNPTLIWDIHSKNLLYNYQDSSISLAWLSVSNFGNFIFLVDSKTRKCYLYNSHFSPNPVIEPPDNDNQTILYPNPATEFIEISLGAQRAVPYQIRIYNVFGELVYPTPALPGGEGVSSSSSSHYSILTTQYLKLDVSGLPPGLYFVRVGGRTGKFLKL